LGISMPRRRFVRQSTELIQTVVDIAAEASRRWRDDCTGGTSDGRARPPVAAGGEVVAAPA
jgi:hypothetical protein